MPWVGRASGLDDPGDGWVASVTMSRALFWSPAAAAPGHTAVLDGIGLQWLLDPSTDVVESITTYVDRAVLGWRVADRPRMLSDLAGCQRFDNGPAQHGSEYRTTTPINEHQRTSADSAEHSGA
jgi:hypothetical protein